MKALANPFRHVGGDITCGPVWMTDEQVEAQLDLALRENDACLRAGDRIGSRAARSLFLDLSEAVKARDAWRKAAGIAPADPKRLTSLALGELLNHQAGKAA